jgi:hypothetical protein
MKTKYTFIFRLQKKELILVPAIEIFKQAGHTVVIKTNDKDDSDAKLVQSSGFEPHILFTDTSVSLIENGKNIPIKSVAFDVYGTLLGQRSEAMVSLLKYMKECGMHVIVWTASTVGAAKNAGRYLKINEYVDEYDDKFRINLADIAFDDDPDQSVLGKLATICIT